MVPEGEVGQPALLVTEVRQTRTAETASIPGGSTVRQTLGLLGAVASLTLGMDLGAAEPTPLPSPLVVTNYVLVTNVVVVTNYVFTPRTVVPKNETSPGPGHAALPALSWVPPADSFDWIQLKSGEWLKGRLKAMQDRHLDFYSEELKELTFEWKDIRQVRSPRLLDVLAVTGEQVSGSVTIAPDKVTVGGEEPRVFPRSQLQSLTPGGSKERNYWSGNATLGLTMRSGNTESFEYNAQAHLQRRTPATRLSLDYIGNLSSVEGVESADNHRLNTEFDLWLSRKLYLQVPFVEYYTDPFQNLAGRITVGAGLGYDLIYKPNLEWNVTTGPAYQHVVFESSQPGTANTRDVAALTFSSRFDWDITRRVELILEYRGQYTRREVGETTHHSVSTLSFDLTKRFDLDVSLVWDRIANPKTGSDGVQPQPDDFRLVVGLGLDF